MSSVAAFRRRVDRLDTCLLSDALDTLDRGRDRAATPVPLHCPTGLRPVSVPERFSGPAVTARLEPFVGGAPASGCHLGARALDQAPPGSVIVIDNGGRTESAAWGGLLTRAARRQRVSGVVVDGLCRDIDEIIGLGVPVVARGTSPVTARGRVVEVAFNEPVRVGTVQIRPGDWVVADGSGVVVVPAEQMVDVVVDRIHRSSN